MTPDPSNPFGGLPGMLGEVLSNELNSLNAATDKFTTEHQALQSKVQEQVFQSLADHQNRNKVPPLPENIQEIVNVLRIQPRLIPAVQGFLKEKIAAINTSLDQILGPLPPT
jgi:hypothetical protein